VAKIIYERERPDITLFQQALDGKKYTVRNTQGRVSSSQYSDGAKRPSVIQLIGLFGLVLFLGTMLSKLGLFGQSIALTDSVSIGAAFMIGLVAASSSCIAVAGGIMLSAINSFQQRTGNSSTAGKLAPTLMFILGRVVSYGLLGALIGLIGKSLSPSPYVVGIITIIAALYMLVMGLDMLFLLPQWVKRRMPSMPKVFSHKLMDFEEKRGPLVPFFLGAGTFFLPCGFTQALQLYALTLGNVLTSGLLLGAFALGTTPALFILGLASSSLKGKAGRFFFQFSGALVVVLGFWNIQNGFTILGYPLPKPPLSFLTFEVKEKAAQNIKSQDGAVAYDGTEQIMTMHVGSSGYEPNQFTIRAGVPTKWVVRSDGSAGCLTVLQSPRLGIQHYINPGENTIAFTAPAQPGVYPFSCSMGMYRGLIEVIPNS
ncbi:MAG: sulfite exporter TauE/SafE family protein, partial [bacterium]|nr:sulfite exporter TauE/SafE family protein [bacterium]